MNLYNEVCWISILKMIFSMDTNNWTISLLFSSAVWVQFIININTATNPTLLKCDLQSRSIFSYTLNQSEETSKNVRFCKVCLILSSKTKKIETFKPKILDIFKVEPLAPSSRCLCLLIDIETYFHVNLHIPHCALLCYT